MPQDADRNDLNPSPEARTPRTAKAIGYAVILLLVLAIVLLASGVVKMSPVGGP